MNLAPPPQQPSTTVMMNNNQLQQFQLAIQTGQISPAMLQQMQMNGQLTPIMVQQIQNSMLTSGKTFNLL